MAGLNENITNSAKLGMTWAEFGNENLRKKNRFEGFSSKTFGKISFRSFEIQNPSEKIPHRDKSQVQVNQN